jgi:hypothetical protein
MISPTRTIDRRDAAVTAALAGAVLVILGYASGIGLRPEAAVSATPPVQSPPTPEAPLIPTPSTVVPHPVVAVVPVAPAMSHAATVATVPGPTHAMPSPSTPSPDPLPTPVDEPTCSPGLVEGIVGNLPLVTNVASLLSGLVGSGPLGCTIGAVIGPSCCGNLAARISPGATP